MKKLITLMLALVMLVSLYGCGKAAEKKTDVPEKPEAAEAAEEPEKTEPKPEPEEKEINLVVLKAGDSYTCEGDFELSKMYSDILTDASVVDGWVYYYSEGTESGTPAHDWVRTPGTYTSCEIIFTLTNLKDGAKKPFTDRLTGFIVYNLDLDEIPMAESASKYLEQIYMLASAVPEMKVFTFTPLQENPGQLDDAGYEAHSRDAAVLEKGQSAKQFLIADISEQFYRSWESDTAAEPMWAFFSYGDDTVFAVNLRTDMKEA